MTGPNTPAIADTWRSGYIPLQDQGFPIEGTTIRTRNMRHAVRIVNRLNQEDELGLGHYVIGKYSNGQPMFGDIIGGMIWQNETVEISGGDREASLREIPAWAFAWPATIMQRRGGTIKARPLFDEKIEQDDRFVPQVVVSRCPMGPGRSGVVLDSTMEEKQIELFLPADGITVSHWRGKAPNELSSLVFDIDSKGEIDDGRVAPFDTAWRVSRPIDSATQALAWNITSSPSDQGFGMLVGRTLDIGVPDSPPSEPITKEPSASGSIGDAYDKISTGGGTAGDDYSDIPITAGGLSLAYGGVERGGPLYVGAGAADKHTHGFNADGEPVGPAHIQAAALFFATDTMDAPLEFRLQSYPGACIFQKTTEVHLTYDGKASHPYIGGDGSAKTAPGLWRWHSFTPWKPSTPGQPIPPVDQMSMVIPTEQSSADSERLFPERTTADRENQAGAVVLCIIPPHLQEGAALALARMANYTRRANRVGAVESDNEIAAPTISWRPEKTWLSGGDLRYSDQNTVDQQDQREYAPYAARAESFAAGSLSAANDWEYNDQPDGEQSRYRAGSTTSGGVAFLPAELGIEDVASIPGWETHEDISAGDCYYSITQSTLSICQLIDCEQGRPILGYDFSVEESTGDLEIDAIDAAGAATRAVNVTAAGVVRFGAATEYPIGSDTGSGPITLDMGDHTVIIDNTGGGTYTVNLPASDADSEGRMYQIKRINGGGATRQIAITCAGGDAIDGGGPLNLEAQYDSAVIKADGAGGWWTF